MSSMMLDPDVQSAYQGAVTPQVPGVPVPQLPGKRLGQNPQLPEHPLGAYTDAQYEAEVAQLRAEIQRQYADVLKQLGYTDETGKVVPGQVEAEANRQRAELGRSSRLATEEVTKQAQREGTLFSGRRGTETARAEHPFVSALADLDVRVPQQLADLYERAGGLISDFTLKHNMALANAAARRAAAINQNPGGAVGPDPSTGQPVDIRPGAPLASVSLPPVIPPTINRPVSPQNQQAADIAHAVSSALGSFVQEQSTPFTTGVLPENNQYMLPGVKRAERYL